MNKNINKVIIFSIICTDFSTWVPSIININQYAYAYSDSQITNLKLISGLTGIPLYSSISYKNEYRIKTGDKIPVVTYSKLTSDEANIKLDTIETNSADVRVFVGEENLKLDNIYSTINIAQGEKKIVYVRLYDSKNDADNEYTSEYELIIEREVNDNDDTSSEDDAITLKQYDDIYLDKLILHDETQSNDQVIDFNFDKTQPIYNLNVPENISYIKIKAVPEEQSYKLWINDDEVDTHGNDQYEKYLRLDERKNLVKIRIIDSFNHKYREYYLNVTRGTSISTTNNSQNKGAQNLQMQANGSWQYKKADGTLATGWTYIGTDWYYFDSSGIMKTGWFQDTSGKWYYFNESGIMAKDTVIDGYKIGSDGVYVGKV